MPFKDESVKNYLPPSFMPTPFDVVCARGKEAFQHPGNKRYREIIDRNLSDYIEAENKIEKSAIVMKIVEEVRCDAPAGFVRYCDEESLWYEIGDEAAREKVGQTIRETVTQRDPEKRAKKRIKRAICKAKREAARDELEVEPIPFRHFSSNRTQAEDIDPAPTSLVIAQSAPASMLQYAADQVSTFTTPMLNPSFNCTDIGPPITEQTCPDDVRIPPPPLLRTTTSKELESLAATPPSLSYMNSREWLMEEGYTMQDADFENIDKLFDDRREHGISAAA